MSAHQEKNRKLYKQLKALLVSNRELTLKELPPNFSLSSEVFENWKKQSQEQQYESSLYRTLCVRGGVSDQ